MNTELLSILDLVLFSVGDTAITFRHLVTACLIFFLSLFVSGVAQHVIGRYFSTKKEVGAGVVFAIKRLIHYAFVVLGTLLAAQAVGINLQTMAIIFGFLGVGIGFGLQNITSNFVSGLILLFERPVSVGDQVTVDMEGEVIQGVVTRINIRTTLVQTFDNLSIIVPNSRFVEQQVVNWSYGDTLIRLHVEVGVAYGTDLDKATEVILNVAKSAGDVREYPAPEVRWLAFGESSIDCELVVWTDYLDKRVTVKSNLIRAIDKAFKAADIRIPFPQRDLHLQSGPAVDRLAQRSS